MNRKEIVLNWLHKKGVLVRFLKNMNQDTYIVDENLITSAFDWETSPEGHQYWADIDKEFAIFIHNSVDKITFSDIENYIYRLTTKDG